MNTLFHEVNLEIFSLINAPLLENVNAPGAFIRRNTVSAKFGLIFSSVTLVMGRCLEINTSVEYGDVNLRQ
jgi:hypothetical protein